MSTHAATAKSELDCSRLFNPTLVTDAVATLPLGMDGVGVVVGGSGL